MYEKYPVFRLSAVPSHRNPSNPALLVLLLPSRFQTGYDTFNLSGCDMLAMARRPRPTSTGAVSRQSLHGPGVHHHHCHRHRHLGPNIIVYLAFQQCWMGLVSIARVPLLFFSDHHKFMQITATVQDMARILVRQGLRGRNREGRRAAAGLHQKAISSETGRLISQP